MSISAKKKHINTKHQEESHEVDLLFSNANNEKELMEANKNIKELEDKVEQLTLSKASAESEACRSKSMAENLQMLLDLQGGAKATTHPSKRKNKM